MLAMALIAVALSATAQNYENGSVTRTDSSSLSGRLFIDAQTDRVIVKQGQNMQAVPYKNVTSVTMGDRTFVPTKVNGKTMLATTLVQGRATLLQISESTYTVTKGGVSQMVSTGAGNTKTRGILSVLFKDCNVLRGKVMKAEQFPERDLIAYVNHYNDCDRSSYTPSAVEAKNAGRFNTDIARFYAGVGTAFNSVAFFDSEDTKNQTSFTLHAGVAVTPGFLGKLQGNIYFTAQGGAGFSNTTRFGNSPLPASFRVNSYRLFGGTEFHFNKKGKVQPFVGAAIGAVSDTFKGTYNGDGITINGGNTVFAPSAGFVLNLQNGRAVGLRVKYFTGYDNDLSFPKDGGVVPLEVENRFIATALSFYF